MGSIRALREGSGNPADAEKAYFRALELEPDNPDTVLHVGRVKLALNDPASAATYFERATAFASPSLDAAMELQALRESPAVSALSAADKARDEKRWVEAIEAYETFLRLRPGAARIWVQLGHALQESGKAHEAEKAYLKALELDPENPDTLLHLGRIKRTMNDPEAAVRYFEQAAAFPSPSLNAWNELLALRPHSPAHPLPFSKKALRRPGRKSNGSLHLISRPDDWRPNSQNTIGH